MDQEAKVRCGVGQDCFCDTEHGKVINHVPSNKFGYKHQDII